MKENTIGLEIPGDPEYVGVVREAVESIARRMPFDAVQIDDLKLAVGEACTNAVKYGCSRNGSCKVRVKCTISPDSLAVEIRNAVPCAVYPKVPIVPDLSREGGLGLYMIKQLMDKVELKCNHNTAVITMTKKTGSHGLIA